MDGFLALPSSGPLWPVVVVPVRAREGSTGPAASCSQLTTFFKKAHLPCSLNLQQSVLECSLPHTVFALLCKYMQSYYGLFLSGLFSLPCTPLVSELYCISLDIQILRLLLSQIDICAKHSVMLVLFKEHWPKQCVKGPGVMISSSSLPSVTSSCGPWSEGGRCSGGHRTPGIPGALGRAQVWDVALPALVSRLRTLSCLCYMWAGSPC